MNALLRTANKYLATPDKFRETDRVLPVAVNENIPRAWRQLRVLVCLAAAAVSIAAISAMARLVF
jgi:hypothetical protein